MSTSIHMRDEDEDEDENESTDLEIPIAWPEMHLAALRKDPILATCALLRQLERKGNP